MEININKTIYSMMGNIFLKFSKYVRSTPSIAVKEFLNIDGLDKDLKDAVDIVIKNKPEIKLRKFHKLTQVDVNNLLVVVEDNKQIKFNNIKFLVELSKCLISGERLSSISVEKKGHEFEIIYSGETKRLNKALKINTKSKSEPRLKKMDIKDSRIIMESDLLREMNESLTICRQEQSICLSDFFNDALKEKGYFASLRKLISNKTHITLSEFLSLSDDKIEKMDSVGRKAILDIHLIRACTINFLIENSIPLKYHQDSLTFPCLEVDHSVLLLQIKRAFDKFKFNILEVRLGTFFDSFIDNILLLKPIKLIISQDRRINIIEFLSMNEIDIIGYNGLGVSKVSKVKLIQDALIELLIKQNCTVWIDEDNTCLKQKNIVKIINREVVTKDKNIFFGRVIVNLKKLSLAEKIFIRGCATHYDLPIEKITMEQLLSRKQACAYRAKEIGNLYDRLLDECDDIMKNNPSSLDTYGFLAAISINNIFKLASLDEVNAELIDEVLSAKLSKYLESLNSPKNEILRNSLFKRSEKNPITFITKKGKQATRSYINLVTQKLKKDFFHELPFSQNLLQEKIMDAFDDNPVLAEDLFPNLYNLFSDKIDFINFILFISGKDISTSKILSSFKIEKIKNLYLLSTDLDIKKLLFFLMNEGDLDMISANKCIYLLDDMNHIKVVGKKIHFLNLKNSENFERLSIKFKDGFYLEDIIEYSLNEFNGNADLALNALSVEREIFSSKNIMPVENKINKYIHSSYYYLSKEKSIYFLTEAKKIIRKKPEKNIRFSELFDALSLYIESENHLRFALNEYSGEVNLRVNKGRFSQDFIIWLKK